MKSSCSSKCGRSTRQAYPGLVHNAGTTVMWADSARAARSPGPTRAWQHVRCMPTTTRVALPSYQELIYPTIRAVDELGGSAQAREITAQVLADIGASDE